MPSEVTVIDYGVGNARSIFNMLRRAGVSVELTRDPVAVRQSKRIIFPGVGSFDRALLVLDSLCGLRDALEHAAISRRSPFLGICLGMQLLFDSSEEGTQSGFGWLSGNVVRLQPSFDVSVPHMGWESLNVHQSGGLLSTERAERFYFAHSYVAAPSNPDLKLATVKYGIEFTAAIRSENIMGVQFHPEKSHKYGLRLLQRFSTAPC